MKIYLEEKTLKNKALSIKFLIFMFVIAVAIFISAREKDYYSSSANDISDYEITDDNILYEGFKNYNLNPGTYVAELGISDKDGGVKVDIIDTQCDTVITSYSFDDEEKNAIVEFTLDSYTEELLFRVYQGAGSAEISWLNLSSKNPVYSDAYFKLFIFLCLTILLTYAYYKSKNGDSTLFILTVFALVISGPFFIDYVPLGNDTEFHLHRIIEIADCFKNMQFPPRVGIYGHITNIMYPNLFMWPSAFLYCMRASLTFSYNFLLILISFSRVFLSYYSGKILLDNKKAILFSVVYSLNVYVFNNIYMRSAIGEALAMLFVPLYIASLYQFINGEYRKGVVHYVISLSGIIQSHIVTTFLMALFTGCAIVVSLLIMIMNEGVQLRLILKQCMGLLLAGLTTVGINLWFLGPFLKFWNYDFSIGYQFKIERFSESALYLFEFFMAQNSIGVLNEAKEGVVGLSILIALALYCFTYRKDQTHKKGNVFAVVTIVLLFLQSKLMPWNYLFSHFTIITFISKVQFATRFMVLGAVFMSLTEAIALDSDNVGKDCVISAKSIKFAVGLICTLYFFIGSSNYLQNPQVLLSSTSANIGDIGYQDYSIDGTDYEEVMHRMEYGIGVTTDDMITIANSERIRNGYSFEFYNGNSTMEHEAVVSILYYGLHSAFLENESGITKLNSSFDDETGLTKIQIPQGVEMGKVTLVYSKPTKFLICDVISIVAIIAFLGCEVLNRKKVMIFF